MLNAWDGVLRATTRLRPRHDDRSATVTRLHRGTVRVMRRLVGLATGHPTSATQSAPHGLARHDARRQLTESRRRAVARRHLLLRLTSERTVPLAVALVVLAAGVMTLGPSVVRPVGAAQAAPQAVRIAIGGGVTGATGATGVAGATGESGEQYSQTELAGLLGAAAGGTGLGTAIDDGTLYKPVAVDTTIETATGLLSHYTVKAGDSLSSIATRFHVSTMTIWWANHLTSKDQLHVGENVVIPPVDGLIVTVKAGDSIDALATKYKIDASAIVTANELTDTNLILGEVLILPGAKGAPIPVPKVTVVRTRGTSGFTYTGGAWSWPVIGGGNYVSQYFWSGHPAVDIAAAYGTRIVAPRAGTVVYAGWNNNGCGYDVDLSIGGGIYIELCHMSAVHVSVGQVVARGQQVGNVGATGWATGTHCHFAVWVGFPWKSSSYRINALRYY